MGPEESMQIQSNIASTIAMAFDECVENPAAYDYAKSSCERTVRWLVRCKAEMRRLNSLPETINKKQLLFGINQGSTYEDLRIENMRQIAQLDLDGLRHWGVSCWGKRRGNVPNYRGGRAFHAEGQAALFDGGRHAGQYIGGRVSGRRFF